MEEVCKLMADYINQRNALEYSAACGDFDFGNRKDLYDKRQELGKQFNNIADKLNELGFTIYTYE